MKPEDLVCYCGEYGGTCARWEGYTALRDAAGLVGELCDAHGFTHWMPGAVREFDYREFRKGLEFFARDDSWLVCHRCCRGGDGYPECDVRRCCQGRGHKVCFDCPDFPCPTAGRRPGILERAAEYRRLGPEKWLAAQVAKAEKGYELHVRRYVTVQVDEKE